MDNEENSVFNYDIIPLLIGIDAAKKAYKAEQLKLCIENIYLQTQPKDWELAEWDRIRKAVLYKLEMANGG